MGLTNYTTKLPACSARHAVETYKGSLDDLKDFNKSRGWPDREFPSREKRIERERQLTAQSRGANTRHTQANVVTHTSSLLRLANNFNHHWEEKLIERA